jgi:hypothetical protein
MHCSDNCHSEKGKIQKLAWKVHAGNKWNPQLEKSYYRNKRRSAESFQIFPFSIFPLCCYVIDLLRVLLPPWLGDQLRSKSLEKLNPRATTTP